MRLIKDGVKGVWRDGVRGRLYTYHYTVSTRMTSSDESHFNVSVVARDKVTDKTLLSNLVFYAQSTGTVISRRA